MSGTSGKPLSFGEENLLSLPIDRYDESIRVQIWYNQNIGLAESSASLGGTAVFSPADEPVILVAGLEEISETFVEIRHLTEPKRVVTVIEVISHTNKTSAGDGRKSYFPLNEPDASWASALLVNRGLRADHRGAGSADLKSRQSLIGRNQCL